MSLEPKELLQSLSTEEKLSLLVGAGLSKKIPGAAGETRNMERVGLPGIVLADGPAGVRIFPLRVGDEKTYYATAFPSAILLASTWNTELVRKVGKAIGLEAAYYGIDILLAPGVNIHRVPIAGRVFEYFSEDPVLSGEMAAAYVNGVQSVGVGATLKHFVAHEQETNRLVINVVVSERALREIYLRPFEIAVRKSKPWAIMAAYNKLNGRYCTQNPWLLTQVLRKEWGFDGLVMTDWGAGDNPIEQILAGVDLIMPGGDDVLKLLLKAYKEGLLSEETIESRAGRVLDLVSKTLRWKREKPEPPSFEEHSKIALDAALEGVVLLENKSALPLSRDAKVALFGRGSYWTVKGGLGSGDVYPRRIISIAEGLRERGVVIDTELEKVYREIEHRWYEYGLSLELLKQLREKAFTTNDKWLIELLLTHYIDTVISYITTMRLPEDPFDDELLRKVAERNDVAIITLSRISSEGFDRRALRGDFYLREDEERLIARVVSEFHKRGKKVIAVLNVPSPIDVSSWRSMVDAILLLWLPGQEGGRALASILLGDVSPSGKLPLTWPRNLYENPSTRLFPGEPKVNPTESIYSEGIYVGYRYYDAFGVDPLYEFGFGLSYTEFEYENLWANIANEEIEVGITVRNIGKYPGKEVVQIYVAHLDPRLDKPPQELKGFAKTRTLKPGESEELRLEIPFTLLASWNGGKWIVEKGRYEIRAGASSRRIRSRIVIEIKGDTCYDPGLRRVEC